MLQDIITDLPAHLPFLFAIVLGGLAGNALSDRKIQLPGAAYIVLALTFVASLVGSAYCLENGPWTAMVLLNAVTAACMSFALTSSGEFGQPVQYARSQSYPERSRR